MNRKRKVVILIAASLLMLSGMFPNWVERAVYIETVRGGSRSSGSGGGAAITTYIQYHNRGRALLLTPPDALYANNRRETPNDVIIDFKRLFLEWVVILIPSVALWVVFSGPAAPIRPKQTNPLKPKPVKPPKEGTIADYEDWKKEHGEDG